MIRKSLLFLILLLPLVFAQNETVNESLGNGTLTNQTLPWYESYVESIMSADVITLASVIAGLLLVYVLGKIAFKFIKWAIIILIIILALRVIL